MANQTSPVIQVKDSNVGIGTTSPASKLHIDNAPGSDVISISDAAGSVRLSLGQESSYTGNYIDSRNIDFKIKSYLAGGSGGNIFFQTGTGTATTKVTINVDGNVGIGTTSPLYKVHAVSANFEWQMEPTTAVPLALLKPAMTSGNNALSVGKALSTNNTSNFRYTHIGDASTSNYVGVGFWGNDDILNVVASGYVGIGTTSPIAKLHISSSGTPLAAAIQGDSKLVVSGVDGNVDLLSLDDNSTVANSIGFGRFNSSTGALIHKFGITSWANTGSTGSNTGDRISFNYGTLADAWSNSELMTIKASGNVGIGTTSPNNKLVVSGSFRTILDGTYNQGILNEYVSTYVTRTKFGRPDTTSNLELYYDIQGSEEARITRNYTTAKLKFDRGATTDMIIDGSGNVGIGTTAPAAKLDISGGYIRLQELSNNANGWSVWNSSGYLSSRITTSGHSRGWGWEFTDNYPDNATPGVYFRVGYNGAVSYLTSGNFGIGTTSPTAKLDVRSSAASASEASPTFRAFGYDTDSYFEVNNNTSNSAQIRLTRSDSDTMFAVDGHTGASYFFGNMGIGQTAPSYKLDVSGTIRATGDVIAYSDARVKENVETLDGALGKVMKMRGVSYNKIGEHEKKVGVIAQEILKVLPEVVSQDETGTYSVAYGNITAVLIEAIKELTAKVEQLEAKLK